MTNYAKNLFRRLVPILARRELSPVRWRNNECTSNLFNSLLETRTLSVDFNPSDRRPVILQAWTLEIDTLDDSTAAIKIERTRSHTSLKTPCDFNSKIICVQVDRTTDLCALPWKLFETTVYAWNRRAVHWNSVSFQWRMKAGRGKSLWINN